MGTEVVYPGSASKKGAPAGRKDPAVDAEKFPRELAKAADADAEAPHFWRFLWPSIYPYRGLVLTALSLSALHGLSITFQTIAPKYLIDQVILATGITQSQRWHRLAKLLIADSRPGRVRTLRRLAWHEESRSRLFQMPVASWARL